MGRVFIVILLGAAIFFGGGWALGLFDVSEPGTTTPVKSANPVVAEDKLGDFLYPAAAYPAIAIPKRGNVDSITVRGVMNPTDSVEVAAEVAQGTILFVGVPVEDNAVAAAGSAAFLAEPYYFAPVRFGNETRFLKFYRRLYEGDTTETTHPVGMIDPAKAMFEVIEKTNKIEMARAEQRAAKATEDEAYSRWARAKRLRDNNSMPEEEYNGAVLTRNKTKHERESKEAAVKVAQNDKVKADNELANHFIRANLSYKRITIKSIARDRGYPVKTQEPTVMTVQSVERLKAEGLVEEQYFALLKQKKNPTATIEPSILENPLYEIPAHDELVTSVAVSKDMKIVSGGDDKIVNIWSPRVVKPLQRFEFDSEVKSLACTPAAADRNLCLVGCADGSIHVLNLDEPDAAKATLAKRMHRSEKEVTSLAFSPDGKFFASGALDGTIRMWVTARAKDGVDEYAVEQYPFDAEHGVAHCHDNAVTSLHFTPQCRLVSAGRDNTLRVWKLKTGGAVPDGHALLYREGHVTKLGVSHDGKWMLFDSSRLLKWLSVENHQMVHTLKVVTGGNPFDTLAIFSPDDSLVLTAGAAEGRLQLWRAPDAQTRAFEVRQFGTNDRVAVSCAAFSPQAGKGGESSFAVSGSGKKVYVWGIPTPKEVTEQRVQNVPVRLNPTNLEYGTSQGRLVIMVDNQTSERYPNGRFEAGRPVTIVID